MTVCYDNFPSLYFMFNGLWVEVRPEDYVVDASAAQDRSLCVLLLQPSTSPVMIFGMPLLRGYYVVHDVVNSQIGFAPASGSTKTRLVGGQVPAHRIGGRRASNPAVLYSWLAVVAVLIVWCLIYFLGIHKTTRYWALCARSALAIFSTGAVLCLCVFLLQPYL